jgi:nucleoside-diphosphate-sugar epimerase
VRALVLGGYGVFGSIACRELARRGHRVTGVDDS